MKRISHHLKHAFIPHEHNDYRPHILREFSLAIITLTIVFAGILSAANAYSLFETKEGRDTIERVLIDLTNQERNNNQLSTLAYNNKLRTAALNKANDMNDKNYFGHVSPTGKKAWQFLQEVDYKFELAGENLAMNVTNSEDTVKAWMNSPLHRYNILSKDFKEIGIGVIQGKFNDYNTVYVVQMFGSPYTGSGADSGFAIIDVPDNEKVFGKSLFDNATLTNMLQEKALETLNASNTASSSISSSTVATNTVIANISNEEVKQPKLIQSLDEVIPPNSESVPIKEIANNLNANQVNGIAINANNVKVSTSGELIRVSNISATGTIMASTLDNIRFDANKYIIDFIRLLTLLVSVSVLLMLFIEFRRHHIKHIIYGSAVIGISIAAVAIIETYFKLNIILI